MMNTEQHSEHCTTSKYIEIMKKFFNTLGIIFLVLFVFEFFVSQWLGDNKWASVIGGHKFTYHMHLLSIDEGMIDSQKTDLTIFDSGTAVTSEERLIGLGEQFTPEETKKEMKDDQPDDIIGWLASVKGWNKSISDKVNIENDITKSAEAKAEAAAQIAKNQNDINRTQNLVDWLDDQKPSDCEFCKEAHTVAQTIIQNGSLKGITAEQEAALRKGIAKYQGK